MGCWRFDTSLWFFYKSYKHFCHHTGTKELVDKCAKLPSRYATVHNPVALFRLPSSTSVDSTLLATLLIPSLSQVSDHTITLSASFMVCHANTPNDHRPGCPHETNIYLAEEENLMMKSKSTHFFIFRDTKSNSEALLKCCRYIYIYIYIYIRIGNLDLALYFRRKAYKEYSRSLHVCDVR